jgi:hypothetical protein
VDNQEIGPELLRNYWLAGSGEPGFLKMVEDLTGKPLSHDSWVSEMSKDTAAVVTDEKAQYGKAVEAGPAGVGGGEIDLGMHAVFVHGDEVISDSKKDHGYVAACAKFKAWVNTNWPKTVSA